MRKMVTMSKRYPPEVREKALRLALDRLDEYGSAYAAAQAIGSMVDVHPETLRLWIVKAQSAGVSASAPTMQTAEQVELERLRRENRELKQANEIVKLASAFFARELDPRHPW